jgi:TPR repeat protein
MLAQYYLAEKYFSDSVPDYPKAKKWYLAAALQGHGPSELRLAFLYAEAHFKGLTVNYAEAEKWFLKAAQQNAGDAQFRLGNFYHNYKNPPETDNAILWLTRAAEGGHRVAMFDLSRMIKAQNPEQSLVWMQKAADLDLVPAQMTLSEMYATGDGVPKDPKLSLFWTLKIAVKPTAAPYWVDKAADIFFEGWEGIPKNYLQAMELYERAAAKNDHHALARLGLMHLQGLSVPIDKNKAEAYLTRASALGNSEAKELLKGLRP